MLLAADPQRGVVIVHTLAAPDELLASRHVALPRPSSRRGNTQIHSTGVLRRFGGVGEVDERCAAAGFQKCGK
jgi:hypothetical protein